MICDGCSLKPECSIPPNHTESCPCINCLVKPICQKDCVYYTIFRLDYDLEKLLKRRADENLNNWRCS